MKILFITNHLNTSDGWSRYSLNVATAIQNLGHEVKCLVHKSSTQNQVDEQVSLSEPLNYLLNPWIAYKTASVVNKVIQQFSPQIIHFLAEPYVNILPFLKQGNYRTVLTVHGTYAYIPNLFDSSWRKAVSGYFTKLALSRLDCIVPASNFTKEFLLRCLDGLQLKHDLQDKITVVNHGIDLAQFPLINLEEKPHPQKVKQILFVGAVKPRKGIAEAVSALKFYHDHFSEDFIFQIVGNYEESDAYYRKLNKLISDHNLEDKIQHGNDKPR